MGLLRRFVGSFRREALEDEAGEELAFHLEQRAGELIRAGVPPEQAWLAARRQIGNLRAASEQSADVDALIWLDALRRDVQLTLRTLHRYPIFACMTVLSLALGLGVNTVVFTAMKQVVLDALPATDPTRLVILHCIGEQEGHISADGMQSSFSYPQYVDLADASKSIFDGVLARFSTVATMQRSGNAERVRCELISGNYFNVLGVKPWRGRLLTNADNRTPGAQPVAVLSYATWQRNFGSDPALVGQTLRLNGQPYQIVGIAPPGFYGVELDAPAGVFVPIVMKAQITPGWDGLNDRFDHWAALIARLGPAVSLKKANAALSIVYPPIRDKDLPFVKFPSPDFRRDFAKNHIELSPGGKGYADLRERLRSPLQLLTAMAALVLVITVVNVANLLIARGAARRREIAVRMSIGAGRLALIRQVLVESVVLAAAGGLAGVAVAYAGTPLLLRVFGSNLSETSLSVQPDPQILFVMGAVTVLAGLSIGIAPAVYSARTELTAAVREESGARHTARHIWFRRGLVGVQLVFSLLLLTGALLFTRSLHNLRNIDPGFDSANAVTFKLDPGAGGYSQPRIAALAQSVQDRLAHLPSVQAAGLSTLAVLEGDEWGKGVSVEGQHSLGRSRELRLNATDADFRNALQIPLVAGRWFRKNELTQKVAVVNQRFAKAFLGGADPIGKHFQFGSVHGTPHFDWTIIGVTPDVKTDDLRAQLLPFAFIPYQATDSVRQLVFYVRAQGDSRALMDQIRTSVRRIDASLPVFDLRTLDEVVAANFTAENALMKLASVFAALAIALALVGLYGVVSYSVVQRTREFGIRMALGAQRAKLLCMVLRETGWTVLASIAAAVPFVIAGGRWVGSLLYGVQANDPVLCTAAAVLIFLSAMLAGTVPAKQAASTDPLRALKAD